MTTNIPPSGHHSRRQRARKACTECRRRKRKCDGLFPCLMCSKYDYQCRYEDETPDPSHNRLSEAEGERHHLKTQQSSASSENSRPGPVIPVGHTNRGVLDPSKPRYMNQSSAVAFPNQLGAEFQSVNPPRLHSFAWNCGIRPEEPPSSHTPLSKLLSFEECQQYAGIYFSIAHDTFPILDQSIFMQQCDQFWKTPSPDLVCGAVIAGVVALGSLLAFRQGHPREAQIAKHVKDVLEDSTISRRPSVDQIQGWILRTLYLRSTTRPHLTWLASSIAAHLAEAVGLHRYVESETLTRDIGAQIRAEEERRRRTFWIAWSLNTLTSYEYGRTRKAFDGISCRHPSLEENSTADLQFRMAQLIPDENSTSDLADLSEILQRTIQKLHELEHVRGFPTLTRADICFCLYRRLRLLKVRIGKDLILCILNMGRAAVETACDFAQRGIPWWNILSSTFQFFCVLLAINTSESLSQVSWVLSKLEEVVQILGTHLAFEALETARSLLRDSMAMKRQELALMEMADGITMPSLGKEVNLDWDAMLDSFYTGVFSMQDFGM